MPRNPRYDILFEPVRIGPVTARNRFYQVPHCTGMGYDLPHSVSRLRELKSEGLWGVVNTEYCSMHWSSEDAPYRLCALWDENDVKTQSLTVEKIKRHGALAGVELWHGGNHSPNKWSRETPLSPSGSTQHAVFPMQTRAMDRADIRNLRKWQVDAAKRAKRAGFDIVYVYAGHGYLPFQFITKRWNQRGDEYGGAIENRARLLREMIEDTKDAVGDTCAVAVRLAVDELMGPDGVQAAEEGEAVISLLAELPDLWDVNISYVENDSMSSRFGAEAHQEKFTGFVKKLTTKPVVGVGRFTSPDTMVDQVKRGILDFIGAARPSIADPFIPLKINEGREEDIRECIGCNICRAQNNSGVPIRCTQNPTIGEEYRRGWHPEIMNPKNGFADEAVLVVGAGPAGLECAMSLARRGYDVALADASRELGGRLNREPKLPGLAAWVRVRDYRLGQIAKLSNIEIFRESRMDRDAIYEAGFPHVILATGASWRRDGIGHNNFLAVPGMDQGRVLTPDDIMAGAAVEGPVIVYDDDQYYMGGVIAEKLRAEGHDVTLVTPGTDVSNWSFFTDEQFKTQAKLMKMGVRLLLTHRLAAWAGDHGLFACNYTGEQKRLAAATLVSVTSRQANDALFLELKADEAGREAAGIKTIRNVGDSDVPGAIVHAVYAGHKAAREFGEVIDPDQFPFKRELVFVK
ncbi:dimethylamine/trimethylamine dehydrogenase [Dongia mobilis]|uniref:Dimethylamine/trimethylamine dehydrogenase n=1 Tax=Dongia mobilis TaxID=578943 RepID=A0A4R6WQA4_9PROT|nr:FAD-dependent oxidoreductase [Dongia mobilis]TDQ83451.1 dimethylamine/trimethylamine dehydrogenase [Dongia mobilis]